LSWLIKCKYGLARSRNHAFNVLVEKGLFEVKKEVEYWEGLFRRVEEIRNKEVKLSHDGLNELLAGNRER
jgi:hypothetical protein